MITLHLEPFAVGGILNLTQLFEVSDWQSKTSNLNNFVVDRFQAVILFKMVN